MLHIKQPEVRNVQQDSTWRRVRAVWEQTGLFAGTKVNVACDSGQWQPKVVFWGGSCKPKDQLQPLFHSFLGE